MTAVVNDLTKRWSGQGTATLAQRTNGVPGPFYGLGRVFANIQAKVGLHEERDIESGMRELSNRWIETRDMEGDLVIESFTPADLARYFFGEAAVVNAGTVTAENLGTLAAGQIAYLDHRKVSSLVLTDSAGSPATLVAGTNYATPTTSDLAFGKISMLDVTGLTMPIKAAYSYAANVVIGMLTDLVMREYELRIELINTYDNTRLLIVSYRVQFEPNGLLELIQEKGVGQRKIKFTPLADPTKSPDDSLGRFGFIEHL